MQSSWTHLASTVWFSSQSRWSVLVFWSISSDCRFDTRSNAEEKYKKTNDIIGFVRSGCQALKGNPMKTILWSYALLYLFSTVQEYTPLINVSFRWDAFYWFGFQCWQKQSVLLMHAISLRGVCVLWGVCWEWMLSLNSEHDKKATWLILPVTYACLKD